MDDVESNRVKADMKLAEGLGELVVFLYRSKRTSERQAASRSSLKIDGVKEIAEKTWKGKAVSHGVG